MAPTLVVYIKNHPYKKLIHGYAGKDYGILKTRFMAKN